MASEPGGGHRRWPRLKGGFGRGVLRCHGFQRCGTQFVPVRFSPRRMLIAFLFSKVLARFLNLYLQALHFVIRTLSGPALLHSENLSLSRRLAGSGTFLFAAHFPFVFSTSPTRHRSDRAGLNEASVETTRDAISVRPPAAEFHSTADGAWHTKRAEQMPLDWPENSLARHSQQVAIRLSALPTRPPWVGLPGWLPLGRRAIWDDAPRFQVFRAY